MALACPAAPVPALVEWPLAPQLLGVLVSEAPDAPHHPGHSHSRSQIASPKRAPGRGGENGRGGRSSRDAIGREREGERNLFQKNKTNVTQITGQNTYDIGSVIKQHLFIAEHG